MVWKRKKIRQELTVNEVFKLYSKWVFKGPECGRRIPIRFDWDNPPKGVVSSISRYQDRR